MPTDLKIVSKFIYPRLSFYSFNVTNDLKNNTRQKYFLPVSDTSRFDSEIRKSNSPCDLTFIKTLTLKYLFIVINIRHDR